MNNGDLTAKQLATLKEKLLEERRQILEGNGVQATLQDGLMQAVRHADEADQAQHETQQALKMRFRNRELLYLKKIEEALDRMEQGTYGVCKETGDNIGFKRLFARPTAELSLEAKENQERLERQSVRMHKSVGQTIQFRA